ncbi:patatin-like phospholipase family protein [Algibacter amylolyticus]|uniref:Patatin-like phospholipase family protein n=1 Tax=Algibacter amylolyticus TaxID=1608400 RepID=A0A5M7B825_9FLAO|nr:patatin-like phospholipase family protein [Algibacter amylolyticus]KAA5825696.1 patatin-like phospholipase family protein [Algibacter amylolyticus]MBB5268071.1 putative patatin/cPLA2 family phospholipase [Algibacter amylolyticus]TSJ79994.1 patatin-like phospholipase family protein [Algibacter amylolyticus]
MKALVISGGGSKGAYAGGVAEYLIKEEGRDYDMFLGTSTGSLLIPHLAAGKIDKIHKVFTNVNQKNIFSVSPFVIRKKGDREYVSIDFLNSVWQFIKRKRTFGESKALRRYLKRNFTYEEFKAIKETKHDVVVTVSNLSKNIVEYKSIKDFSYDEFCDWIWISCNYIPFMSLVKKDGFEYADGAFGCVVPIREAILRGATEIDAIILESESMAYNKVLGKNPFSLMLNLFGHLLDQVERSDILIGKLAAKNKHVKLNLYYTPSKLTENSLVFNKKLMTKWWQQGYYYAKNKFEQAQSNELREKDLPQT